MLTCTSTFTLACICLLIAFSACGNGAVEASADAVEAATTDIGELVAEGQEASAKTQDGIPAVVAEGFASKYPGVQARKWGRDRNNNFEAQFEQDGMSVRADFTPAGAWIETERGVKWNDLPSAVQQAITSEFKESDIVELEFTQNAERGDFYDVEIDPKGNKKFDIEYRADGTVLTRG